MSRQGKSGHDDSLVSSMAARLRQVEEELQNKTRQLQDKDKQLHHFRVSLSETKSKDKLIAHLRAQCEKAFAQIQEMEEFLADYGMIWVGNSESPENIPEETEGDLEEERKSVYVSTWNQEESVGNKAPDYNKIIHNVHELNILAGDGVGTVARGPDGISRVVQPDPVPLALYSNGICLYQGPFRPLSDPVTRQFVADLEEGYFPSELQERFPNGVVLELTDLREKEYVDRRQRVCFPGRGTALSEGAKELAAIRGYTADSETAAPDPSDSVQKPSVERFLSKLPANVIRDGKIIDIRESVSVMVGSSSTPNKVSVAETAVVKQIQAGEGTTGPVATLRVKLNGGANTLIVKLQYSDTIKDLRDFIDQHKSGAYEIRTTFPNRIYEDVRETLQAAGLVPSATLHIRDL